LIRIAREREISLAYLTAADEAAARIYVRAGFAPTGLYQTNISRVSSDT
jgi:predicted GNAT family acetyltransferase